MHILEEIFKFQPIEHSTLRAFFGDNFHFRLANKISISYLWSVMRAGK